MAMELFLQGARLAESWLGYAEARLSWMASTTPGIEIP